MKKLLIMAVTILMATSAMAATTVTAPYEVPINRNAFIAIDNTAPTGAAGEVVRRSFNTTSTIGNNFVWGGFNGGTGNAVSFGVNVMQYNNAACRVDSYVYTRFDDGAITEGLAEGVPHNTSSVIVDASAAGSSIVVNWSYVNFELGAAILLRDDTKWYQSSSLTVPFPGAQRIVYPLTGASAVTWQAVDLTVGGGLTLDLVQSGDEGPLTLVAGAVTPNFASIQGVGQILTSPATPGTTGGCGFNKITFAGPPPAAPTGLGATTPDGVASVSLNWDDVAGVTGYNVYRSETAGSGYVKVNTALLTESQFDDTTVTLGTTFYYVVRSVAIGSVESVDSSEVSIKAGGTVSSVEDWRTY